ADCLGQSLMEPSQPADNEDLREFGAEIAGADGRIDRAKLAAVVFADREKLERLNGIVHPRVLEEMQRQFAEGETRNTLGAAFVEAALIIEAGYQKLLDGVVVTWCKPEQQLARLLARGLSAEEARRRIAAQMPVEERSEEHTSELQSR